MMHFEEVVVTLVDTQNKPFRELNSQRADRGRKCEVYAQADTEYKFLVKNNTDKRIKVDIDIDGSSVSGNGLILGPHSSEYIERFVDIDRKFKTSLVTGEGVADPTSPENGIIKVRVHKEKFTEISLPVTIINHHHHHDLWWNNDQRNNLYYGTKHYTSPDVVYGGVLRGVSSRGVSDSVIGTTSDTKGLNTVSYSASLNVPKVENLATVEGGMSDQKFTSTIWNGDDTSFGEIVFTFFLKLASQAVDQEYLKYLELKKKFG